MSRPVVTTISPESIEDFTSLDDVVFIGYISSDDDTARQSFSAVAQKYRQEFTFGLASDQTVIEAGNMESPTVMCHVAGDGETRSSGSFSEPETLDKFVSEASRRVIEELTCHNHQRLIDVSRPSGLCAMDLADVVSRSAVGPLYMCLERRKMTAQSFVGHSMISQKATTTL